MYDARAVANFFIDRAQQRERPITALTLLKVLYFAHAWHLAKFDRPLVGQPFEAWQYGPVNRVVYDQIKGLSKRPVNFRLKSFDAKVCSYIETSYEFKPDTEKFLSDIFDYYSEFEPFALSDLTHEDGSPWSLIWEQAEQKAIPGMQIPDNLIKKWFRERRTSQTS